MENGFAEVIESYRRRLEYHSAQCHHHSRSQSRPSMPDGCYGSDAYAYHSNNDGHLWGQSHYPEYSQSVNSSAAEECLLNSVNGRPTHPQPPGDLDLGMHQMTCSQNSCDLDIHNRDMCSGMMAEPLDGVPCSRRSWFCLKRSPVSKKVGDVYPEDLNSPVRLRKFTQPPSPLVEKRNIRRLPRPITTPAEILSFSHIRMEQSHSFDSPLRTDDVPTNYDSYTAIESPHRGGNSRLSIDRQFSLDSSEILRKNGERCLDTQSLSSTPEAKRRKGKSQNLHRFNSLSPTFSRKSFVDKVSPSSLRKSVILRSSSRKSEPVYIEMCGACGFPLKEDNRIAVSAKGGKRKYFHAECFKCSVGGDHVVQCFGTKH